MSDVRIKTRVKIDEVISDHLYHGILPNGKRVLAFAQPLDQIPALQPGDDFGILFSLCNFDEGRLVPHDLKGIQFLGDIVESDMA